MAGRRTYTEEELQNALQDILSGKLGTRRAAVLYGIPRSTLRNKVYKLAMEQKREASMMLPQSDGAAVLDDDDDDKDIQSGAEDEKDMMEKAIAGSVMAHQNNILRLLPSSTNSCGSMSMMPKFSNLFEIQATTKITTDDKTKSPHSQQPASTPTPPIVTNPWLDPVMLQNLLLADPSFPEVFRNLLIHQQGLMKSTNTSTPLNENNGSSSAAAVCGSGGGGSSGGGGGSGSSSVLPEVPRNMKLSSSILAQKPPQQQHKVQNRLKSETPDTASSLDPNDLNSDDAAVILKIPSFKPIGNSNSTSGIIVCKNGSDLSDIIPRATPPPLPSRTSPGGCTVSGSVRNQQHEQHHHQLLTNSPPLLHQHGPPSNESNSPPMSKKNIMSLRDVIAKSLTKTFSQQSSPEPSSAQHRSGMAHHHHHHHLHQHQQHNLEMDYKRPSISVIKNLGGTDMSRFASSPNMMGSMNANNSNNQLGGAGGKGTRPKRGKYRNYDRDSLVEAVKAVQRGEMSVHRAGSYYGVPHSTLEYKVKERHLMRPRKREPKPQQADGGAGSTISVGMSKTGEEGGSAARSTLIDKSKTLSSANTKTPLKTETFPETSPNGMKMGMFDPAQLQYTSHLYWPHATAYSGLDFARTAGGTSGTVSDGTSGSSSSLSTAKASVSFPAPTTDAFFASQMMQRIQEDALRQAAAGTSKVLSSSSSSSSGQLQNNSQTSKEIGDNLYCNGSLLDGIIRHSLDRKSSDSISHGALLDQLVKNNKRLPLENNKMIIDSRGGGFGGNTHSGSGKRIGSPLDFVQTEIKRERTSSISSTDDNDRGDSGEYADRGDKDSIGSSGGGGTKYRTNLFDKGLTDSTENINGASPDVKHSDNEDSS